MPPEAPIPLTVIGGYLGSGKTTFINRIIAGRGAPGLCVIVNDFGELDIDAEILRRSDGLTLTLANGCICCSAASGLYDAFEGALNAIPRPGHILIEASGVADPARLNAIARAEPSLEARAVITIADCLSIERDIEDALRSPDIRRQLRAADLILLSKADLASGEIIKRVRRLIRDIAPVATIEVLDRSVLPDALTLAANTAPNPRFPAVTRPHEPEARYETCSFRCGPLGGMEAFVRDVAALPPSVVRFKGIVQVAGDVDPCIVDRAGGRVSVAPLPGRARGGSLLTAIFAKGSSGESAVREVLCRNFSSVSMVGSGSDGS